MAQEARKYSTYYYQRATLFEQLPITSKDIVFVGNSITDGGEW
ncbi:MAG: sialate O-acetylesterase, partial [Tannerellaceae bacterium]